MNDFIDNLIKVKVDYCGFILKLFKKNQEYQKCRNNSLGRMREAIISELIIRGGVNLMKSTKKFSYFF